MVTAFDRFRLPVEAWRRPKAEPPLEWVPRNVYFSAADGAVAGHYSFTRFPYVRRVFEAVTDPEVETVVLSWATQTGKTSAVLAVICWVIRNDPCSIMVGSANQAMAQAHSETKLQPMLEACPAIARRLAPKHRRKWWLLDLGGARVWYAWPGSKGTISDRSVKYLFINELGLWDVPESLEGDPLQMILDRTKAFPFPGRKIVLEGKPTVVGDCRLTAWMERSTDERYHVPCQACGHYQPLVFGSRDERGGIKFERGSEPEADLELARRTTRYECVACGHRHAEEAKILMLNAGVWAAKGEQIAADGARMGAAVREKRVTGLGLSSLYSTIATWSDYAGRWLQVQGSLQEVRAFLNGWAAEAWVPRARRSRVDDVAAHCDDYLRGQVPAATRWLIVSCDVQESSIFWVLRAWAAGGDSWLVDYGQVASFADLEATVIGNQWETEGELFRVAAVLVDSSYRTQEVYAFAARRQPVTWPCRMEKQYTQAGLVRLAAVKEWGISLINVDSGQARDQLYEGRLPIQKGGRGYWALPQNVGRDYLVSLAAWERREDGRDPYGRMRRRWVSHSQEHEHLADCEILQEVAAIYYRFAEAAAGQEPPPREQERSGSMGWRTDDGRPWFVGRRT